MTLSPMRRRERRDLIKLSAFLAVAALVTVWVGAITAEYRPGDRATYYAVFDDVSGLSAGDGIRVAGVDVGKVDGIEVQRDQTVLVTFSIRQDQTLTASTRATVQYRNLTGDRIILLTQDAPNASTLSEGGTIPASRTAAALDLDTLLNGFRPLFQGLSPQQINELSGQLVQVLQGQQSAISSLVNHVALFTTTLGSREELVGQVIRNLNSVVGTVDEHSGSLAEVIDGLDALVRGIKKQDTQLLDAADRISRLAGETSTLLASARGDLRVDLISLRKAARGVNKNATTLEKVLTTLPEHYLEMQNMASYGNYLNFYLCGVQTQTDLGVSPWILSEARRCQR